MTARPPRASTKSDGKRPKRGATQGERTPRPERVERVERGKPRAASVMPTDPFVPLAEDYEVELAEPPPMPAIRLLVLEAAMHQQRAQAAIVAAGHSVVPTNGVDGMARLGALLGEVDAVLIGLPGGEPLIDAVLAIGPGRPVVITAWTATAVEASRRAAAARADLATIRPHDPERLAPLLLAAARLVEQRARPALPPRQPTIDVGDEPLDAEPGGLVAFHVFEQVATGELDRARRHGYPLAVALFGLEVPAQAPPPALKGLLRARAGNALVHALRDVDLATEMEQDRFLVLMPYTERLLGAEVARKIIGAVAAVDPIVAVGRSFPLKLIGAVAGARAGDRTLAELMQDATQLLEQAQVTGASLAVES